MNEYNLILMTSKAEALGSKPSRSELSSGIQLDGIIKKGTEPSVNTKFFINGLERSTTVDGVRIVFSRLCAVERLPTMTKPLSLPVDSTSAVKLVSDGRETVFYSTATGMMRQARLPISDDVDNPLVGTLTRELDEEEEQALMRYLSAPHLYPEDWRVAVRIEGEEYKKWITGNLVFDNETNRG